MINRVLIRIKVVQMLYSYLLTHHEFKIQPAPDSASRDKVYAYRLYMELLIMLTRFGGYTLNQSYARLSESCDNKYLRANTIVKALQNDNGIRQYAEEHPDALAQYVNVIPELLKAITTSTPYRSYIRNKQLTIANESELLVFIIKNIISKSPEFIQACSKDKDYTVVGFENGIKLAINTIDSFGYSRGAYVEAKNSLARSLDKSYELYHSLLVLPIELTHLQDLRLETAKTKFLPTEEDLYPNTKFVDNLFVKKLEENEDLEKYIKENPISWNENPTVLRSLLDKILESDIYKEYMADENRNLKQDGDFWRQIMKNVILPSDILIETLESQSVYWNDDVDIIGTFVLKTIKRLSSEDSSTSLLPKFKDDEDAVFGSDLFVDCIKNYDVYKGYIDKFINAGQWDPERLAFMDVIIMIAAISELLNYPAIPIPVTLNEYIEIANSYSTPKSGQFINGILFSVINYLKSEGKLLKN